MVLFIEAYTMIKINPFIFLFSVIGGIIVYTMADTWGLMPKSQIDPQTIEERIAEMIQAHESDPEAHLGVGESLETHRANDVIDHRAFSILDDKFAYDRNFIDVPFVNIDLFDHGPYTELNGLNGVYFYSSGLNHTEWLSANLGDVAVGADFEYSRLPRFYTRILLPSVSNSTTYIIVGETDEGHGFGFKIVDGIVYGVYFKSDFSEQTLTLQSISANTVYKLEARVVSLNSIEFYINNLLVNTFENCIFPTGQNFGFNIPWITFKRTLAGSSELFIRGFYWEADYPS